VIDDEACPDGCDCKWCRAQERLGLTRQVANYSTRRAVEAEERVERLLDVLRQAREQLDYAAGLRHFPTALQVHVGMVHDIVDRALEREGH